MKEIKNYEVIINEGNARAALIIQDIENAMDIIKDKELEYNVDFKENKIFIFEENKNTPILVFNNANLDLLKFVYKSNGIPVAIGTVTKEKPEIIYETYISLR